MRNLYGNDNHSDQEELVENLFSAADDEDEEDDDEDEEEEEEEEEEDDDEPDVFSNRIHMDTEREELISISLVKSSNDCDNALMQMERSPNLLLREQQQHKQNLEAVRRAKSSFCTLLIFAMGLVLTSALLLVLIPLYQSQFIAESTKNNSHGMLLFLQPLATLFFILTTIICSAVFKWNIKLLKLPSIPGNKLFLISLCFGLASTLVTVGSFKRVACHLQDPLKGTALAFSLLFYFFFCTRLMGLQKIFSATTSVIGLFISVDYGLCDEFHCHGNVISFKNKISHTGWQGRAFWALIYTIGISLWSLHIALLEGCFVESTENRSKQTNFLRTISKFVSSHDDQNILNDTPAKNEKDLKVLKNAKNAKNAKNMHPMHVAMWVHIFGTVLALFFGFVDIFPITGTQIKSFSEHWMETKYTFQCHLNVSSHNTVIFDLNSNTSKQLTINNSILNPQQHNTDINFVQKVISDHPNRTKRSSQSDASKHQHKITHLNAFLKYKNTTSNHLPSKSGNVKTVGHKNIKVDCSQNSGFYALILVCTYVGFVVCLFNILSISQSAVLTVAMATVALPFTGLFWSFYKLDTRNGLNAAIVWSPSVSGELICSLLGTPIVFLGIFFLFKSHYSDMLKQSHRSCHKELVT